MNCHLEFEKYGWLSSQKGKVNLEDQELSPTIFLTHESEGEIVLLLIYDKENASSVKVNVLKQIIKEEGYPLE